MQLKWQKLKIGNLKNTKKKQPVTCKETPRVLSVYFLAETVMARREFHGIFKVIKGKIKDYKPIIQIVRRDKMFYRYMKDKSLVTLNWLYKKC